jgi:TonB family protein
MNANKEKPDMPQYSANKQRDHEWKALKIFLAVSIPCSIAFHFATLSALPQFGGLIGNSSNDQTEELLELQIVEEIKETVEPDLQPEQLETPPETTESLQEAIAYAPIANLDNLSPQNAGNLASTDLNKSVDSSTPAEAAKDIVTAPSKVLSSSNPSAIKVAPNIQNLFTGKGLGGLTPNSNGKKSTGTGLGKIGDRTDGRSSSRTLGKIGAPFGLPTGNPNSTNTPTAPNAANPTNNSSGKQKIRCQSCAKPEYPVNAKERGLEGEAKVAVDVDANGNVINVRLINSSGHPELDEAAKQAARNWKFDPSQSGKEAIPAKINFQIENSDYARRNQEQRRAEQEQAEQRRAEQEESKPNNLNNIAPINNPVDTPKNTASQTTQPSKSPNPEVVSTPIATPESLKPVISPDSSTNANPPESLQTSPIVNSPLPAEAPSVIPETQSIPSAETNTPVTSPLPSNNVELPQTIRE